MNKSRAAGTALLSAATVCVCAAVFMSPAITGCRQAPGRSETGVSASTTTMTTTTAAAPVSPAAKNIARTAAVSPESGKQAAIAVPSSKSSRQTAAAVLEISDATFEAEVLQSKIPVLVDFWAPWCGWCLKLAPINEELAVEFSGKVKFCKMNTDKNSVIPEKFNIGPIPALLFFENGQLVNKLLGYMPKEELKGKLEAIFGKAAK